MLAIDHLAIVKDEERTEDARLPDALKKSPVLLGVLEGRRPHPARRVRPEVLERVIGDDRAQPPRHGAEDLLWVRLTLRDLSDGRSRCHCPRHAALLRPGTGACTASPSRPCMGQCSRFRATTAVSCSPTPLSQSGIMRFTAIIVDTTVSWRGRSWVSSPGEGEHETVVKFIGR